MILVHCIHPGTTRTPRQITLLDRQAVQDIPIGRMVEPEDIAALIVFLVSARASAMTGQVIAVDGGAGRGIFY